MARMQRNSSSLTTFSAGLLPYGRSTIGVAASINQAGAGYLGGLSRTLFFRR
jgi:hypothetical protein